MRRGDKAGPIRKTVTLALVLGVSAALAFTGTENDTFEDGTTMGWEEGPPSPNPPENIPDGGPGGVGDNYLQNISSGSFGPGGQQVMFNLEQWAGDYNAVGPVIRIAADMASFGPPPSLVETSNGGGGPLPMRVAVQSVGGTWYASTEPQMIPEDGQWYPIGFELSEATLTLVSGLETLSEVLDDVLEMRILAATDPDFQGDRVAATLGVDNFRVLSVPVELQSFSID